MAKKKKYRDKNLERINNHPAILGEGEQYLIDDWMSIIKELGLSGIFNCFEDPVGPGNGNNMLLPNRVNAERYYESKFGSLEQVKESRPETKLFKAIIKQNDIEFSLIDAAYDIHPKLKAQLVGLAYRFGLACRDKKLIEFLIKQGVDLENGFAFEMDKSILCSASPPIYTLLKNSVTNPAFFDEDLAWLLIENGMSLDKRVYANTNFLYIVDLAPQDFAIRCLKYVQDLELREWELYYIENGDFISYKHTCSYFINSILKEKCKLAVALIEKGADINYSFNDGSNMYVPWELVVSGQLDPVARIMLRTKKLEFSTQSKFKERIEKQITFEDNFVINKKNLHNTAKIIHIDKLGELVKYYIRHKHDHLSSRNKYEKDFFKGFADEIIQPVKNYIIFKWWASILVCKNGFA